MMIIRPAAPIEDMSLAELRKRLGMMERAAARKTAPPIYAKKADEYRAEVARRQKKAVAVTRQAKQPSETCNECLVAALGPKPEVMVRTPRVIEEKQRTESYLTWKAQNDSRNAWVRKANARTKRGEFQRRVVAADAGDWCVEIHLECGHWTERADGLLSDDFDAWVERSLAKLRKAGVPSKADGIAVTPPKPKTAPKKAAGTKAAKRAPKQGAVVAPKPRRAATPTPRSSPRSRPPEPPSEGQERVHVSKGIRSAAHEFTCQVCGTTFTTSRSDALFCSNACRQKDYRRRSR